MGNGLYLPICQPENLEAAVTAVTNQFGIRTFATVLDGPATSLPNIARAKHQAIFFGNESHGLSEDWIRRCDDRVTIPMQGGTDSLNVAFAAGIFPVRVHSVIASEPSI